MKSKTYKIFTMFIMLCMISGVVIAEQQGNLPINEVVNKQYQLRSFGYFNDGSSILCQDLPDDAGTPTYIGQKVWCTGPNGVTEDLEKCVVQFFDAQWNIIREDIIKPSENTIPAPVNTAYWQRFNCYKVPFQCDDFIPTKCGASGNYKSCQPNEKLHVRTCSDNAPASVETERCVAWRECYQQSQKCQYSVTQWGQCVNNKQSRVVTYADCSTKDQYQGCVSDVPKNPTKNEPDNNPDEKENVDYTKNVATGLKAGNATAFYDRSLKGIVGRVEIKNEGSDMTDTHLLEMQVMKKGTKPLSFISDQRVCDSNTPTNVHILFKLDQGESEVIELFVSEDFLEDAEDYEVYFLTRHKCYKDLTQDQLANEADYQIVPPFESYSKLQGIIHIGGEEKFQPESENNTVLSILPYVLIIIGAIMLFSPLALYSFIPIIVGAGWLIINIIQALM